MTNKRSYTLRKRAESREETHARIVEATMHLHEELGPRATTISAIAERAGVQRLTVYRHFSDETAIFQACTSHWASLNPAPDPGDWQAVEDGMTRARIALAAMYAYYRRTERMWTVSYRDVADVPALQGPMAGFQAFLRVIGDDLLAALAPIEPDPVLGATVHHTLAFSTWGSLNAQGLDDAAMVDTVMCWIAAACAGANAPRQPTSSALAD